MRRYHRAMSPRIPNRIPRAVAGALLLAAASARADTPAFDRPGISFSTQTLPPGSFDWEQGLPDVERDSFDGARATSYSADTTVRIGLARALELQLGGSAYDFARTRADGHADSVHGGGDTSVALKAALPSSSEDFSWAALARVGFATGSAAFSAGRTQVELATSLNFKLGDALSTASYAKLDRLGGASSYGFAQSLAYTVSDATGVYVELGAELARHQSAATIAGGGVTYMITPTVQLDLFGDFGLSHASPDLQAGFGVSAFFE